MQKWLLTIIIAILPVNTACSKTDTEVSVPEEETGKKTEIKFLQLNLWALTYIPNPENKPCVCHKDNNRRFFLRQCKVF